MEEYRQKSSCCSRTKVLTEEREKYYDALRKKNIERYVRKNRKIVDAERKVMRLEANNKNISLEDDL